ncbi:MAG: hypothetical protein NWE93_08390 [Candidatus Bathyarchaeota archaeon]|nr:hypothetical protein [Candidatus Bathyarchaeota archaeon]
MRQTIGYVTLNARSVLEQKPNLSNVAVVGTCMDCRDTSGFFRRNF